jgi:hypothetical protein
MTLKGPTPEDVHKIHAEVNQLVNQRFTLTTLAVTVFIAGLALLLPRDSSSVGTEVGIYRYSLSILLLLFLLLLFYLAHRLTYVLRTLTTYLDVSGVSGWESDWREYRGRYPWYIDYPQSQSIVFLGLGIIAGCFPFSLGALFRISLCPQFGAVCCGAGLLIYLLLVSCMGFGNFLKKEKRIRQRWQRIKEETES